ncbi:MAG: hypothetical protein JW951_06710 [Lentisphaerae bacterium]|nr:hypothetical protein [Lentisphaerota bacterium]
MTTGRQIVRAAAGALLAVWLAAAWTRAWRLYADVRDAPYAAFFALGLVDDVRAVREGGAARVYVAGAGADDYVLQRLSEMLYPVRVVPWSGTNAPPGPLFRVAP